MSLESWINRQWYESKSGVRWMTPLAALYRKVVNKKRAQYLENPPLPLRVPVVVVGNLTAGGAGKTPLVAEITRQLQARGHRPAIISRGYGGKAPSYPYAVTEQSHPLESGDEPLLLRVVTSAPVYVDPERARAAEAAIAHSQCDVLVADDGLQHYGLWRSVEVCVVDGSRGFGNGKLIPQGPLREPLERLDSVDFIVVNGAPEASVAAQLSGRETHEMHVAPARWHQFRLDRESDIEIEEGPRPGRCHVVAGIANPGRVFRTVEQMGFEVIPHPFDDHHEFTANDLKFGDDYPVIMTMKDAVKCRAFWQPHWWALEIKAELPDALLEELMAAIGITKESDEQ
ncbi:tetraacyldisaccharide 4'-kinase [Biformimicrobium ophioploci]|uniref:Tetraacyldisaccharide 4'-kinase n=1 Tax=Biformimicrobium ophioploci TaxID=3036711 RepID=A0ABQ6M1M9_9GAMM|nr:tetraacyldisaccharide 4'-kinase [Microbulbifer sp. NKW57]GMG88260.1 tetraacyldisaccharide 4'-kinase [Microbulbifer sp. NKW57]